MHIEIKKREGESLSALLYRFNKRIKRSGVLKEVKFRRFRTRSQNRSKRRLKALYRLNKEQELAHLKKYGHAIAGRDNK